LHTGTNFPDRTTQETITRLKGWINELNALLKEFSRTYAI
jgi:hypothetical protein